MRRIRSGADPAPLEASPSPAGDASLRAELDALHEALGALERRVGHRVDRTSLQRLHADRDAAWAQIRALADLLEELALRVARVEAQAERRGARLEDAVGANHDRLVRLERLAATAALDEARTFALPWLFGRDPGPS